MKNFSKEEHIKKHTQKEGTYNNDCVFCVYGDYVGNKFYLAMKKKEIKQND